MAEKDIAQAVLASLRQVGVKVPVEICLKDGTAFRGIIMGLNGMNDTMFVEIIDTGTDQVKRVAIEKISAIG